MVITAVVLFILLNTRHNTVVGTIDSTVMECKLIPDTINNTVGNSIDSTIETIFNSCQGSVKISTTRTAGSSKLRSLSMPNYH
jgi:hypothetical protein